MILSKDNTTLLYSQTCIVYQANHRHI